MGRRSRGADIELSLTKFERQTARAGSQHVAFQKLILFGNGQIQTTGIGFKHMAFDQNKNHLHEVNKHNDCTI